MDVKEIIKSRIASLGDKVYVTPSIPSDKVKNAVADIAHGQVKSENVIAVWDKTVFGACDEGLLFADDSVHYREMFSDAIHIRYSDIERAAVSGAIVKDLLIYGQGNVLLGKIENVDFKANVAADILSAIVLARKEEEREVSEAKNTGGKTPRRPIGVSVDETKEGFENVRNRLKKQAWILFAVGFVLTCCQCYWWSIPAIIIGFQLLAQYKKDEKLFDEGLPVGVYSRDVGDVIAQAWVGTIIVIGVFFVPEFGKRAGRRMQAMKSVLHSLTWMGEERAINLYLSRMGEKADADNRAFVHWFIDEMTTRGCVVRLRLGDKWVLFDPAYLGKISDLLDSVARRQTVIPPADLLAEMKKVYNAEDEDILTFASQEEHGVQSYTFEDGAGFVHGENVDKIKVCSACGIAHLKADGEADDGEYFCSDICRQTEEMCEKIMHEKRAERIAESGIEGAAFGGALHQVIEQINRNKRNVASRSGTGHGEAAEIWSDRIERLLGRDAEHLGSDNSKNGADRRVGSTQIQCKYYKSVSEAFDNCFKDGGDYRYIDGKGAPMQLEVPKDQYEKALALMREKIREGKVPGVTDPNDAEKYVRKGRLTYQQARNLCKPLTVESLAYDAYTGVIVGVSAGGISFVLTAAVSYYSTKDLKRSLRAAAAESLRTGGKAFCVYMIAAQVQRTEFVKAFMHQSAIDVNWGAHGKFVERIGKGLGKMSGAKSGSFTKNANAAVKGAAITAAATFAVTSSIEVFKMCNGKMSGMQCVKNIAVSAGGITAGTIGALFLGALCAPIPGGAFVGGMLGGALGGMIGSAVTKAGMDTVIEDDSVSIMLIVADQFKILAASFCCNEEEISEASRELDKTIMAANHFTEDVYSHNGYRRQYVSQIIRPIFVRIIMSRPLLTDQDVSAESVSSAINEGAA